MRRLLLFAMLVTCVVSGFAQPGAVTGQVKDEKDQPVPFASIKIKGSNGGVSADADGKFTIAVNARTVLSISAVNFETRDVTADPGSVVAVVLKQNENLKEVVVTALGVGRQKRSIGFAAQQINADKLNNTKLVDLNTALAGKIAGAQIRSGSGAKFGSSSIRLRGVNTLGGGNPIYVIDGVITESEGVNPDDVESLTVLKGPAATALYGQRGSEGAVVITTKKASKSGLGVELNHITTVEKVYVLPEYQNEYGGGYSQSWSTFHFDPATMPANLAVMDGAKYYNYAADESWGPKLDGTLHAPWYAWDPTDSEFGKLKPFAPQPDNVRDFFNTGIANNSTISLSKATAESNTRFSFTNLTRNGVIPNSRQQKNWIVLSSSINLDSRLSLATNINYVYEHLFNVPDEGYSTQTTGSFNQWFQRNIETNKLRRYRRADGTYTTWNITGPGNLTAKYWDNPFTEAYANIENDYIQRVFGNATLSYKLGHGLTIAAIARGTYKSRNGDDRVASFTLNTPKYFTDEQKNKETNILGNVGYEANFDDLSVKANVYAELMSQETKRITASTNGGFIVPEVYTVNNSLNERIATSAVFKKKVNSMYANATLGYRNFLFLDLSVRNDISSTLPTANNSYWYGSAAGSFIFSDLLKNKSILSFGKLRASFARVGTDVGPYNTFETYPLGTNYVKPTGTGTVTYSVQTVPNLRPNDNLEPTLSTSYEIGTELQFLKDRIRLDINYYVRQAKGQILPVTVPGSSGYTAQLINAGNIENKGIEVTLGVTPLRNKDWNWNVDFNLGLNRNEVKELIEGVDNIQTGLDQSVGVFGFTGSPAVSFNAKVGSSYGLVKGMGIKRDSQGRALIDDDGFYIKEDNKELATALPEFTGGMASSLSYKNFFLYASLDFQKGGKLISVTNMFNSGSGLSAETVGLNDRGKPKRDPVSEGGGIRLNGVNENTGKVNDVYVDAQELYESHLFSVWEHWLYDASYVKLRELSLGYNFPKRLYKNWPIQDVKFSVIGQNLWLIYSKVKGIDPSELEQSWIEGGQLPGTRSIGFNLKVTF